MPADRSLTIDGSGTVVVRGMTGSVDVDSDDGRLELDDIAGDITVSNDSGRIIGRRLTSSTVDATNTNGRIELSFLDPPQAVSARTENGRIDVVVPDTDVLYRVDLHTDNGSTDNAVRTGSGLLTATGTVVKSGSRVGFTEGVVTDAGGAVVATATSTLLVFDI